MSRLPTSPLLRLALRGAGCLVFTVSAMGAGCEPGGGGTTGGTGDFGTDGSTDGSSGDPSTTTPSTTTPSTTEPSTTTPSTTTPSTTTPSTTEPSTDTTPDTTDTDPTGTGGVCLSTGTYFGTLTSIEDLYGHFPYLKLFYGPDAPEQTVDEVFDVEIGEDGSITLTLVARDPEGFEGHEGIPDLAGTIDADCNVLIDGSVDYVGGGSPYGTVTVHFEGVLGNVDAEAEATGELTLEGGGIPQGPVTYFINFEPQ